MSTGMNPPSLLLARTPALPSTSTSSTHLPNSKSDYAYPSTGPSTSISLPSPHRPSLSPLANLYPAFTVDSTLPGTVEIQVEATTFLVHKEIMVHASPFFEVLLSGDWAETTGLDDEPGEADERRRCDSCERAITTPGTGGRRKASLVTDVSPAASPRIGGRRDIHRLSTADSFVTTHTSNETMSPLDEATLLLPEPPRPPSVRLRRARPLSTASIATESDRDPDTETSLALPSTPTASSPSRDRDPDSTTIASSSYVDDDLGLEVERPPAQRGVGGRKLDARIQLKEEQAGPFQDLLMFVYPQLECVCTWNNAPELMTMARKFDMPLLRRHVLHFLLSSAAGKPIQAMRIAEDHQLPDLYRESSRFLLDNWQNWDPKELETLGSDTLLKLEKKRSWFLERLLKLGLVNSSRDYVCPPSCPDPQHCARLVDEKWRSAWAASFRYGPPQPSSIYRALRCLEPSLHSPALLLPHTSCMTHAQRFFADLVDRMFGLLGLASVTSASGSSLDAARKAKYFLSVDLVDVPTRERKWTGTGMGMQGQSASVGVGGAAGGAGFGGAGGGYGSPSGGGTPGAGGVFGFPTVQPSSLSSL